MKPLLSLLLALSFALAGPARHWCTDDGAGHVCQDACPSEQQEQPSDEHGCCGQAPVMAVLAAAPAPSFCGARLQPPSPQSFPPQHPVRDVFHPPA